jgi:hypothetical protein
MNTKEARREYNACITAAIIQQGRAGELYEYAIRNTVNLSGRETQLQQPPQLQIRARNATTATTRPDGREKDKL